MTQPFQDFKLFNGKFVLKIAIVGGGRACKFFLDLLQRETFSFLKVRILGVCDINPEAVGFKIAQEMGIYTTSDFRDLFQIEDLDGIIELTNNNDVLLDLINLRPKRIGIIEHNIGRLLRQFFEIEQRLKIAEHQVVLEKAISEFLIRQAKQRIVVLNTDFTIADANDAYLESLGQPRDEVIGRRCHKIMYGLSVPCSSSQTGFSCPMVETLRTGESAHVIHEDPAGADEFNYSEIVTYPVKNPSDQIVRVIEIYRDITEALSHRWEKRMRAVKADLNNLVQEDRLISLGKLVASCVHEINNPIQGLLTYSRLMELTLSEERLTIEDRRALGKYAELMTGELERCGKIVSGLLSFSRESTMEYTSLDVNEVLTSVLALVRHKLELQDIELKTELHPVPLMVRGDMNLLQQCFLNLIFNAIEAMKPGGILQIRSAPGEDERFAAVRITDTGHGIPEARRGHIFDPFFTTKEAGQGTGLGLSIVYGVVKNHEGHIRVDSQVGKGTSFVIDLPCDNG
ncbi:MAG: PAS domain-containing protein [Desulfobacterales bacterium]|nr:PAS domain-containing protein [Desulfobacterales bacterium]